jgi:hypothetical protein
MKTKTYYPIFLFCLAFTMPSLAQHPANQDSVLTIYNFIKCLEQPVAISKSDQRFIGRWLEDGDSIYYGMKDYGAFFSDSNYQNVTIYDLAGGLSLYFKGFGRWYTKDERLYLCTVWMKAKYHYNTLGQVDSVYYRDTTFMGWQYYPYKFNTDSTWCWQWKKPPCCDDFWSDPIISENTGPGCFHRIKTKKRMP